MEVSDWFADTSVGVWVGGVGLSGLFSNHYKHTTACTRCADIFISIIRSKYRGYDYSIVPILNIVQSEPVMPHLPFWVFSQGIMPVPVRDRVMMGLRVCPGGVASGC